MNRKLKSIRGQGTTEYIVVLAIVVVIAVAVMGKLRGTPQTGLEGKVTEIGTKIMGAGNDTAARP